MHPLLFDVLQKQIFASKMKLCFPKSKNCQCETDAVLSLINSCLNLDPQKQIAVKEALNQRLFGGEAVYELEESSPWNRKVNLEQIERLIRDFKIRQTVSAEETDAKQKVLVVDSIGDEIKIDPDEKISKNISVSKNKVFPEEHVIAGNAEVRKADRSSRKQKALSDDYDILDQHVE